VDRVLYLRPDVYGEAALVADHPARHNHTNAALVLADAVDPAQVNVRVGFGRDLNVTLGVETTQAGAGHATLLRAGDAVGPGPSAGGNLTLQPGVGVGGGAAGDVRPYAHAVVMLGNPTTAFALVYTQAVSGANGDSLTLQAGASTGLAGLDVSVLASPALTGIGGSVFVTAGAGAAAGGIGGNVEIEAGQSEPGEPTAGLILLRPGGVGAASSTFLTVLEFGMEPNSEATSILGWVAAATPRNFAEVNTLGLRAWDADMFINPSRFVAGAGDTLFLFGGNAVGAGNAGGDLELGPGTPGGGGPVGTVILSTSGLGAWTLRPDVTALVSLGTGPLGFLTLVTRTVRADDNQVLALSTVRVAAGAGPALTLTTAAATAGSGLTGGDLILVPGAGDGAGTRGLIRITATTATRIVPDTPNVVSLGSTTLVYAGVYARIFQGESGQTTVINRGDGTTILTMSNAGVPVIGANGIQAGDNTLVHFGAGFDATIRWTTASANNVLAISTNVNSAAQSGNIIISTRANEANEHGLAAVLTPRLAIFSAADMSVAGNRTQYVQMYHDGTSGMILAGNNLVAIATSLANATRFQLNYNINGATHLSMTQGTHTSGTPTGIAWIGGPHTGLANASLTEWNVNLTRTLTFLGGGATNFATYRGLQIGQPTLGAVTAGLSVDVASTVYIAGPPLAEDGDITLTQALALHVDAGVSRFDGNLLLTQSVDSVAVADQVSLGRFDLSAGNTVLAWSQEKAVDADVLVASTHTAQVRLNGATYKVLLVAV
jgi:hypothetical protein